MSEKTDSVGKRQNEIRRTVYNLLVISRDIYQNLHTSSHFFLQKERNLVSISEVRNFLIYVNLKRKRAANKT